MYCIAVKGARGTFHVFRRYSQFRHLHGKVRSQERLEKSGKKLTRRRAPQLDGAPPLPPRRFFWGETPSFVESRRRALQSYLQTLVATRDATSNEDVEAFLGLDMNRSEAGGYGAAGRGSGKLSEFDYVRRTGGLRGGVSRSPSSLQRADGGVPRCGGGEGGGCSLQ